MRIMSLIEAKSKGLIEVLDQEPVHVCAGDLVSVGGEVKKVVDTFTRREATWDDEPEWLVPMVRFADGTTEPVSCCRDIRANLTALGEDIVNVEMVVDSTTKRHLTAPITRAFTGWPVAYPLEVLERTAADGDPDPSVHFYTRVVLAEGKVLNRVVMTAHAYKTRPHIEAWAQGLYFA